MDLVFVGCTSFGIAYSGGERKDRINGLLTYAGLRRVSFGGQLAMTALMDRLVMT